MVKLIEKLSKKKGQPPGTMMHVGDKKLREANITYIDYDKKKLEENKARNIEECFPFKDSPTVTWINVNGLHDLDIMEKIRNHFELHPLVMEDIVNTGQRPKMEDYGTYVYIVFKIFQREKATGELAAEQISIVLGRNFVLSFQEREGDVFDAVRERIRESRGRIRESGPDYLAYALLDAAVDSYFGVLEETGDMIESVEEKLLLDPAPGTYKAIHDMKKDLIFMRKSTWPLRETVGALEKMETSLLHKHMKPYLRDLYDHTIQIMDTTESLRDVVSGMLDVYLSSVSNRMNEVMKVLTIFASIFIPLTFVAGVYGMNFDNIPELHWRWGYFIIWGIMVAMTVTMIVFFKKKKWF